MVVLRRIAGMLAVLTASAAWAQVEEGQLTTVKARTLTLHVPKSWKQIEPTSSSRVAEFAIGNHDAEAGEAELVVFYFGGPTGGIRSNLERWISQFHETDRQVRLERGKCREGTYFLADISGTWKKPDGPPFAQKTIDTPDSRVVGVILVTQGGQGAEDYYFLKLSGPDGLVSDQVGALRAAIGVDASAAQPFDLKNAENAG
jgi:gluconolactonase